MVPAGVAVQDAPADMPWGDRRMTLRDPSGITLYVSQALEAPGEHAD